MVSSLEFAAIRPLHVVHDVAAVLAAVQADGDEARLRRHEAGALGHDLQHLGLVIGRRSDGGDLGYDVVAIADFGHGRPPGSEEIVQMPSSEFRPTATVLSLVSSAAFWTVIRVS